MITKLLKIAVTLLCLATAKDLVEEEIKVKQPLVKVDFTTLDWVGFSMGALLGVLIELGTNTSELWPCLGQPSDVGESVYFTYFYIR